MQQRGVPGKGQLVLTDGGGGGGVGGWWWWVVDDSGGWVGDKFFEIEKHHFRKNLATQYFFLISAPLRRFSKTSEIFRNKKIGKIFMKKNVTFFSKMTKKQSQKSQKVLNIFFLVVSAFFRRVLKTSSGKI